jgi:cell division protein FtsA
MLTRTRPSGPNLEALIDIGTSKIVCLITAEAELGWRLLGVGHQRSRGLKAGLVVDMDEAENALRAAVAEAERMAGLTLEGVRIAIACGRLQSLNFTARADTADGVVQDDDVARVHHAGRVYAERDGRCLVAMNRIAWRLDGHAGSGDPVGLAGHRLEADLHAVAADDAPVRNVLALVDRCRLSVEQASVTAHASAMAVTNAEERRLGVTVIDLGAGVTSIAEFFDGNLVGVHALPLGSGLITFDIARSLSAQLGEAERVKTLYGSLVRSMTDTHAIVPYRLVNGDDVGDGEISKAELHDVIRPRVDMLLQAIAERLDRATVYPGATERLVFTGGGSELTGLVDYAAARLARPARLGRPYSLAGLPDSMRGPAFATAIGLLPLTLDTTAIVASGIGSNMIHGVDDGYFGRVGRWIKESF